MAEPAPPRLVQCGPLASKRPTDVISHRSAVPHPDPRNIIRPLDALYGTLPNPRTNRNPSAPPAGIEIHEFFRRASGRRHQKNDDLFEGFNGLDVIPAQDPPPNQTTIVSQKGHSCEFGVRSSKAAEKADEGADGKDLICRVWQK